MGLRQVRYVRGNNRRRLEAANRHDQAILNYNARQPSGSFLLPSQATALSTAIGVRTALLAAVRFV